MSPLDTRKFKRYEVHIPVEFEFKDETLRTRFGHGKDRLRGNLFDISQGGMSIITKHFMPKGIIIKIYVKLPMKDGEESDEVKMEGDIRSVVPWKIGDNRLGIKFTNISEENLNTIKNFIKINERRSEPRFNIRDMEEK